MRGASKEIASGSSARSKLARRAVADEKPLGRVAARLATSTGTRGRGGRKPATGTTAGTRLVRIKALDPCARCGPSTCVEQLYRVDEQVAGTATVHLVFFDRHGWYCVHGATCVAVRDVHAELKAQRAGHARGR